MPFIIGRTSNKIIENINYIEEIMLKKDVVLRESLIDGLKYSKYLSDELIKQNKSVKDIIKNIISLYLFSIILAILFSFCISIMLQNIYIIIYNSFQSVYIYNNIPYVLNI